MITQLFFNAHMYSKDHFIIEMPWTATLEWSKGYVDLSPRLRYQDVDKYKTEF